MAKNKKKKEKVVYYDDGSTIADMSNVTRLGKKKPDPPKKQSTFKEKWKTYISAVKMMLIPMCVALMILCVIFLLLLFFAS